LDPALTASALTFEELFDPDFLARLQQFTLSVARADKGGRLADQKTPARGQGLDFADFKPYVAGDDLRAIDWNIYQRLGRLFVRVFEERQDLPVYVLLDVSRSMFAEEKPRIHAAQQVALALSAVALGQHNSVGLFPFSDALTIQAKGMSGKSNLARVVRALASWQAGGGTALGQAAERLAAMRLRQGLVVVISDFFDEAGLDSVLGSLALLRHRLLLVQLVRPEDADPMLNPAFTGDLVIEDEENGTLLDVTVTPQLIEAYRAQYRAFNAQLTGFATQRGAALTRIDAARDVLDQLQDLFKAGRLDL
jgi:uncharacterized protein (DUF58 family)